MKFAKYLESESIPEWRKAYINYKGLKKRLKAIEKVKKFPLSFCVHLCVVEQEIELSLFFFSSF